MAESVMLNKAKDFAVAIVEICRRMLISSINTVKNNKHERNITI